MKTILDTPGWREIENTVHASIKRKRLQQSALNYEDSAEVFFAFKEKSSYLAGFIQGAEYILNDIKACVDEEASIRADMDEIEKQLKSKKPS